MSRNRLRFVQKALGLQVEDYRLTDRHDDDDEEEEEEVQEEDHGDDKQTREKGGHSDNGNVRRDNDEDDDKVVGGGGGGVKAQKETDDEEERGGEEEEEEDEEGDEHDQDDEDDEHSLQDENEDSEEEEDDALRQRIQTLESQTDSILRSRSELRAVIRDHERFLSAISASETAMGPRIEKRRESELTSLSLEEQHLLRASGTSSACPSEEEEEEEEEDRSVESHETGAHTVTSTMIFQLENPHIDFTGGGGGDEDDVVFEELWKHAEAPKKRRWKGRRRITVGERGEATTVATKMRKGRKERGRRASISFERRTSAESAADSRDGDGGGFLTCTANHWRRWRRASNESKVSESSLRRMQQRQPQRQPNNNDNNNQNNEINIKGNNRPKRRFSMEEIRNRNEENEDIETGTQPTNPGLRHRNSDESWNNGLTYKLDAICKRFSWENFQDDRENGGGDEEEDDDRSHPHHYDSERRAFTRRRGSDDDDDDDDSHSSDTYDGDQTRNRGGNPFRRFLDRASTALSTMRYGPLLFFGRGQPNVETDLRATSLMSKAARRGRLHRRPTIDSDASERFRYSYRRVGPRYLPGGETFKRCLAVVLVVSIVVVASTLIALDVRRREEEGGLRGTAGNGATAPPLPPPTTHNEEELMEIAESINDHCHPSNFHTHRGRFECQTLCRDHLCCFDDIDDPYNCRNDPNKMCAAYIGCQMLVSHLSEEGFLDPEEFPNDDDGGDRYSSNIDDGVLTDDEGGGNYSDFVFTLDDDFLAVQESDANLMEDDVDGNGADDDDMYGTLPLQNDEAGPTSMPNPDDDKSMNNNPNQSNTLPDANQSLSPPPPPPNRCMPEDGEDIDLTDPQFQPCRRWEDKYGITIQEYFAKYPTNHQESTAETPIISGESDLPVKAPTAPSTDNISSESTPSPKTDSTFADLSPEQILQKFQTIAETCNDRVVETNTGRTECENLCDGYMCCFSADDNKTNCRRDNPMLCQVYDPCKVLLESSSETEGTFPDPADEASGNDESNYEDYLHQVTFDNDDDSLDFYLDDEISFSNFVDDTVAFGDDGFDFDNADVSLDGVGTSTDGKADNPENAAVSAEKDSLAIAVKIGQACNDYSVKTPSGRAECLRICDGHFCCFEEEGSGLSCRNDESKLCPVYVGCDVLWNDVQSDRDDF